MFGEEILLEIDDTLDRLIYNAEAIQSVDLKDLSTTEIDAFQKTQESLLQHLLHLDQFFETRKSDQGASHKKSGRYQIQEKLLKFEKLKREYKKKQKTYLLWKAKRGKKENCQKKKIMQFLCWLICPAQWD